MPHPESHLKANQRFKNFWANVSKLDVSKDVPVVGVFMTVVQDEDFV